MKLYDTVVIGGGPAGLSAAIYLARFNRKVVVLDRGHGRWATHEVNENYLGFPDGIPARKLRDLGRRQAKRFGALLVNDDAVDITREGACYCVKGTHDEYLGRSLILAMGVTDLFPEFKHWRAYLGRTLFWCITCDGWKTRGKRVLIVGKDDEAAETAMQFLNYTDQIAFLSNCAEDECELSARWRRRLARAGIQVYFGRLAGVEGSKGILKRVRLEDGTTVETDFMFNQQGAVPNTELARSLGVALDRKGYIKTDVEQRTNVPRVYGAGDVTKLFAHQVVTAAHEGSMAAQAANYDLYLPEQKG